MQHAQVITLKEYQENEVTNQHTTNAVRLIEKFGTDEELIEMKSIAMRHDHSLLTWADYNRRYELSNKYYQILIMEEQ